MRKYTPRTKRDWRKHLTPKEREFIIESDAALKEIAVLRGQYEKKYGRTRTMVVNRAVQRARYEAREKLGMETKSG